MREDIRLVPPHDDLLINVKFDAVAVSRATPPLTDEHYCPRCEYRFHQAGTPRTRWFSVRVEGQQVYECPACNYAVRDR